MADKKLLEETIIARFQQLANIAAPAKGGVLTENVKVKLSGQEPAGGRSATPVASQGVRGPVREKLEDEAMHDEAYGMKEEADGMEDEAADDMAGDEMGAPMEGGDLESAVSSLVDALNGVLAAAGMDDKQVELDSGSGEGEEAAPDMDMGGEDEMVAEADKSGDDKEKMEEELDESIELVDDSLIEKLVQRVSARLVAEARKAKALEEGKKKGSAGNWLAKPSHSKPPKAKGNPIKGGTPFKGGKK